MTYDNVISGPSEKELAEIPIGKTYSQTWRGLPNLPFKEQETESGLHGLIYQKKREYVWITPAAVVALKKDSQAFLHAMISKTQSGKINAWWVEPVKPEQSPAESLEDYFRNNPPNQTLSK